MACDTGNDKGCFIPYTKRQRRYRGKRHTWRQTLFPGYVFLVSGQLEMVQKLKV